MLAHYTITPDGRARILKANFPLPVVFKSELSASGYGIAIKSFANPDYAEFKNEIMAVTGREDFILVVDGEERGRTFAEVEAAYGGLVV